MSRAERCDSGNPITWTASPASALSAIDDVAREDPGMAGGDAVRRLAVDLDRRALDGGQPSTQSCQLPRCALPSAGASRTAS